ncbi:MAG TPA: hypothetical protein VGF55_03645 [Gemmataceae bacterium]|jgi:hypothetical protein
MFGFSPPGHGWHPDFGVCGLCFLHAMFGGSLEPWPDSKAIYGINCPSVRQDEPDWDAWEAGGYGWPPPRRGTAAVAKTDDDSIPF